MNRDELTGTALEIVEQCDFIADMLLDKNRKYGDSALDQVRIFSAADPVEQLLVRIDDKLSRIKSAQADDREDAELDLTGYLILLAIARRRAAVTGCAVVESSLCAAGKSAPIPTMGFVPSLAQRVRQQVEDLGFLAGRNQEAEP